MEVELQNLLSFVKDEDVKNYIVDVIVADVDIQIDDLVASFTPLLLSSESVGSEEEGTKVCNKLHSGKCLIHQREVI
jgi:hypothetical protein